LEVVTVPGGKLRLMTPFTLAFTSGIVNPVETT